MGGHHGASAINACGNASATEPPHTLPLVLRKRWPALGCLEGCQPAQLKYHSQPKQTNSRPAPGQPQAQAGHSEQRASVLVVGLRLVELPLQRIEVPVGTADDHHTTRPLYDAIVASTTSSGQTSNCRPLDIA